MPSCDYGSNGFLSHRFPPLVEAEGVLANQRAIEQEFFLSLDLFSKLYSITTPDVSTIYYPDNLRLSYKKACDQLKVLRPDLDLIVLQTEGHPACLSTIKTFDTSTTLFYIPVEKLYRLIRTGKSRKKSALFLSALAYFYQAGGIPFYDESDSFVGGQYDMIREWTINEPGEWETEDYASAISDLNLLAHGGKVMYKRLSNPIHLKMFESRLSSYKAIIQQEEELLETCTRIYKLYKQYGARSIMDSVVTGIAYPSEEDRIYADQYISFCWSASNWTFDHLTEMVNCSFQECIAIDEPLSIQRFDSPQMTEIHNLDFEKEFFDLISRIIDDLNNLL